MRLGTCNRMNLISTRIKCSRNPLDISAFSGGAPGTVHEKLLRNLLTVSMRKNLSLSQRIFCTTPKTVRGRLLTYFSAQAARSGSLKDGSANRIRTRSRPTS